MRHTTPFHTYTRIVRVLAKVSLLVSCKHTSYTYKHIQTHTYVINIVNYIYLVESWVRWACDFNYAISCRGRCCMSWVIES